MQDKRFRLDAFGEYGSHLLATPCPEQPRPCLLDSLRTVLVIYRMLGPLVGGYLAVWGGFSAPFYAAAIIGVLMIPIPLVMPDSKKSPSHLSAVEASLGGSVVVYLEIEPMVCFL